MTFRDLFSDSSRDYARFRPNYPPELFAWLAAEAGGRSCAVDVATGNGQAALAVAPHFQRVLGLDASAAQLQAAPPHPRVEYRCAPAEDTGLPAGSADLLTAAQAFHWFDAGRFFRETGRVLRPGGLLAIWCYGLTRVTPAIDAVIDRLYEGVLGRYWEPERRLVEDHYRSVVAPFPEIASPAFAMRLDWGLEHLAGYLATWSAFKAYVRERGRSPLLELGGDLAAAWAKDASPSGIRTARWSLAVRAFRR